MFMIRALVTVLALSVIFVLVMSLIIARSITQSVLILEAATRRIASGELDLALEVKGSNEITSLTASLNRMRLALKEDQQRRSRFIMGITHDLKTPLALIKGYAEAIEDGVADGGRSLEIIATKVDQLEGMIDDLLDFVQVDSGEWRKNLSRVNLDSFLSIYTRRIRDDAALLNRRVEISIELPGELEVPMDERLAIRALENLTNNAIRYTAEDGLIKIFAYVKETDTFKKQAVIEVSDNGKGISEEDLPHVFETLYRGSNSRREQGMGLGLAVVKGVADSHGWQISVDSNSSGIQGSRFRIVIDLDERTSS
jgi:signal transduction histidine kinase